jgi:hypothetical protein
MNDSRTPPHEKAKELARFLQAEHADYAYLKAVFRALRKELNIVVPRPSRRYRMCRRRQSSGATMKSCGRARIWGTSC